MTASIENTLPSQDASFALTEQEILANKALADDEVQPSKLRARLGLAFFFLVMVFFSWLYNRLEWHLTDASKIPMAELIIQGQRNYVTDDDVRNVLLKQPAITNYFSVDVDAVQLKIESLPWVYQASVRKIWPDSLRIYIQEQPVIALWNDERLLNEHGSTFAADILMAPQSLVKLYGPDDRIKLVLEKYNAINSLLSSNGYTIGSISLNLRNALTVNLANGIALKLGREDMLARIQRYIDFMPVLEKDKIAYIDLRYDTGFSVGWKQEI